MAQEAKIRLMIACSQPLEGAPEVIRLLPRGLVKSQKGDFIVDEESFREICKEFIARGLDLVIDYEHQTLETMQAPAAGWIKRLTLTDDAICGEVEWTQKGADYLRNREYRYLSPVVLVRERDRKALRLKSAALTNTPAIDRMFPIVNSQDFELEDDSMEFVNELAALLGLPESTNPAELLDAVKAALAQAKKEETGGEVVANKTVLSLLSLGETASTADVTAKIVELQNHCSESTNRLAEQEGERLVEQALKEGKITSAQKSWATQYALSDKPGFTEFLSKAIPVVPLGQLVLSAKPMTRDEPIPGAIRSQLGISTEDIAKHGKDGV